MQGVYRVAGVVTAAAIAWLCAPVPAAASGWWERAFGSGKSVTREIDISGFDGLEISHGFEAEIRRGDAYHVTMTIDEALAPRLLARKEGSALRVGLERGGLFGVLGGRPRVAVTMPFATSSQRVMPPKMLKRIAFTFGSAVTMRSAVTTFSGLDDPPMSRKFAGSPP